MKKLLFLVVAMSTAMITFGQSIKGPESITYFQAPSQGVKFSKADIYLSHDKELEQAKMEEQQSKNSAFGAKFGSIGKAVAKAANKGLSMLQKLENATKEFEDEKGRFAVWNFVPSYILAKAETEKRIMVEIFVLNEQDPSGFSRMPTQADKEGYYDVPYYVNCRYRITDPRGNVILNQNLGVLKGKQKTKEYTPQKPTSGITVSKQESDELTAAERIGINKAYNRVRQEVFARYGFGQFTAPIKLGVIKEIKESKKLIKPTLEIFSNKKGLLLSKKDKVKVQNFVDIIEKNISKTSDKTRWVAYHNLSVCYAWLENPEKAKEYYTKYGDEISETLDKMRRWNLFVQGKLPKDQRKGLVIGMKDQKKYTQYNNINCFVNYYPAGVKRYQPLFYTINRNLSQFVDFYAHNDLLCQLFEIDYPFQFFPLNDFEGLPKAMEGEITKEGMEPINFKVKFNSKRRIKQLEAEQISLTEEGKKEKLISREIKPKYDDNGNYTHMETNAGIFAREMGSYYYYHGLNYVSDPLSAKTKGIADNITKKIGFFGTKVSSERVQLKVDLDGNIFFTGKSKYFKANALFKELLSSNGIVPKRTDTNTKFSTKANINEQGVLTSWNWDGSVNTSFSAAISTRVQEANADRMLRAIKFVDTDEHGNPKKVEYNFQMKGKLNIAAKVSLKEFFSNIFEDPSGSMASEGFDFNTKAVWDCQFTYDAQGNWTEMKVGPYTAKRTFKY